MEQTVENIKQTDFQAIREKLAGSNGKAYWRSLEELAETTEFQEWIEDEFPNRSSLKQIDRRDFLKFMGASLLMASLAGCRSAFMPQHKIVPYVKGPEDLVQGESEYYATALSHRGFATGVLIKSDMGRPTKIEGNPEHPFSMGSVDSITQASVLDLYDPDRGQQIIERGFISSWTSFVKSIRAQIKEKGQGFKIVTSSLNSPSFLDLKTKFLKKYPEAEWIEYEPALLENVAKGTQNAFGESLFPVYNLRNADVVVSFDGDFLSSLTGSVRMARDYGERRKIEGKKASLNRLYAFECTPTLTGANADHRWNVKPSSLEGVLRQLAVLLEVPGVSSLGMAEGVSQKHLYAVANDLKHSKGRPVIIPGEYQSPNVQALAHTINLHLGAVGKTVNYYSSLPEGITKQTENLRSLVQKMKNGKVSGVLILDQNLVYHAPADLQFETALSKVPFKVYWGSHENETAKKCDWYLPKAHSLESWGDAVAPDGTISITQPLIQPLYDACKSSYEILSCLIDQVRPSHDLVQDYWMKRMGPTNFESRWLRALDRGFIQGSALSPRSVQSKLLLNTPPKRGMGIEVVLRPDPTIFDGSYANNGWLQELPKPLTKLTWENTVQMSPLLAERMKLNSGDHVQVKVGNKTVKGPVWILPGMPDQTVTLHLGYGRTRAGMIGTKIGFNAYHLRSTQNSWLLLGAQIQKVEGYTSLASTQTHQQVEGRDIIRSGTVAEFNKNPSFKPDLKEEEKISMFPDKVFPDYKGYQWAMTIDLNQCIGCNACVTACQSENNIPVVGKEQVIKGRVMHWLRVDTYFGPRDHKPSLENPSVAFQPMMCVHCENAPCEPVCPVAATVHSHEGLNQMVYNRCVGTRYCSNNCPYKVRRFNFLNFADKKDYPVKLLVNNPQVTVRGRGVMEKCTYCVQRINVARITSKKEGREIRDGEIVTACQQVCPTQAIVFGNIADPKSKVSQLRRDPRDYTLLEDLNTRPRTTYLSRVTNPNPEIEEVLV